MRGRDEGEGRGAAQAMSPSRPQIQNIPSDLLVFHLKITHSQCSGGSEKHNLSQHKGRAGDVHSRVARVRFGPCSVSSKRAFWRQRDLRVGFEGGFWSGEGHVHFEPT